MKRRILSIVLTICMAFMLMPTVVLAAEVTVTTEEELKDAVQSGGTINLGADIALSEPLIVNDPAQLGFSLTLNMNGYALTGTIKLTACSFTLNGRLDADVEAKAYVDPGNSWPSRLSGGTYAGEVYCNTTSITSGTFLNKVSGQGTIAGGTFYKDVNCGGVGGGSFFGSCTVTNTIWAGIFYGAYDQDKARASYTVRYNSDDKVHAIEFCDDYDSFFGAEAPSKKGYSFLGWYKKDTNGEFLETPMNFPFSSDNLIPGTVIDVYALWQDSEAPVISGVEDGKTYCDAVEFEVSDNDGIASVKAGNEVLTVGTNGKYTLAKGVGTVTVVVTDNAGNTAQVSVTVNNGHTYGEWQSNGDGTHTHRCTVDGCSGYEDGNAVNAWGQTVLRLQATASQTSVKLKWNVVPEADGYVIYWNKCGSKKAFKQVKEIKSGKTLTWTHKKLKKSSQNCYIVRAYKVIDGKKSFIKTSNEIHLATKGGKYTNVKKLKSSVSKVTLKKGKTKTLKITQTYAEKNKKLVAHMRPLTYTTSDKKVATVTKKV